MNVKEFKELETSEKVAFVNQRLADLKAQGLTTKQFRDGDIKMSYDFARDHLKTLGYSFNRDAYTFTKSEKSQLEEEGTTMQLNSEEIQLLKEILAERKDKKDVISFENIVKNVADQPLKPTSVKLREGVASDWADFAKEWGYYNSSDLVSAALVHFMNSFPSGKKEGE